MSDDDDWLLPRLGDLDEVRVAVEAVRRALGQDGPIGASRGSAAPVEPVSEFERVLIRLLLVQAKISAVVVEILEHATAGTRAPMSADFVLDSILTHAKVHSDFESLDDALPFDA